MTTPEIGFKIQGKFYPWVVHTEWKTKEWRLVRLLLGRPLQQVMADRDWLAVNQAYFGVAFWRGNPEGSHQDVLAYLDELGEKDVEYVGFSTLGDDAGPPAGAEGDDETADTSGSKPSEKPEPSSASTPENPNPKTSGSRASELTTASGRPTHSAN